MKTTATALLVLTGILSLPVVTGVPTLLRHPHPARDESQSLEYDCDLASAGLTAGCDLSGYYFTCADNIATLFSCTGGCQDFANGDPPRCDDAVFVENAAYVEHTTY